MKKVSTLLALVVLVGLAPFVTGGYELNVLLLVMLYVVLTVSLNLVAGYAGQLSFSHGAFYGIGAYTTAILTRDLGTNFWINLPAGVVVAGACGLLLGIPALRLKGHYLAIVTIAFQSIVYLTLSQWTAVTGGQSGIEVPPIGRVTIGGRTLFTIDELHGYFWVTELLMIVILIISWRLVKSRIGREWIAVRDDEILASAVGLATMQSKLLAFVISAAMAGAAGVVSAYVMRGVTPDDFTIWISCMVVAMMVVGGRGTFVGPILGAVLLTMMPEFLGGLAQYKTLLFGVLLVIAITLVPDGIIGRIRQARGR